MAIGLQRGNPLIDNRDLRLLNLKREDEIFQRNKIFIEAWQKASSCRKVARKFRMTVRATQMKAARLRGEKIPLKTFRRNSWTKHQLSEMISLAKKSYTEPKRLKADKIILAWNSSKSIDEAIEKTGIPEKALQPYISKWRRRGAPLKYFRDRPNREKIIRIASDSIKRK